MINIGPGITIGRGITLGLQPSSLIGSTASTITPTTNGFSAITAGQCTLLLNP